MKVKSVIIEGFHNVLRKKYDFEDINYLHGPNGAGKSTVLQAIQLGLLGYVPGTNKTKQGIFSHSNSHTMAVKLILDDDGKQVSVQRIWTKSKSSVTENLEIEPDVYDIKELISDVELPLFNFDEFAHMTANTLKDWFLNYLPSKKYTTNWYEMLRKSLDERSTTLYSTLGQDFIDESTRAIQDFHLEGLDEVRQANSYFKSQLSFMKSELNRKVSTIQSLIHYDDIDSTYSIEDLKRLISNVEGRIVSCSIIKDDERKSKLIKDELDSIDYEFYLSSLDQLDSDVQYLVESCKKSELDLKEYDERKQEIYQKIRAYESIISSDGVCNYTKKKCSEISDLVDEYKKTVESLNSEYQECAKLADELKSQMNSFKESLFDCEQKRSYAKSQIDRYRSLKSAYESISTSETSENLDELHSKLEYYKDLYEKAAANKKYEELNEILIHDKYIAETQIEALKCFVELTGVNGLQSMKSVDNPFDSLSAKVDHLLSNLFNSTNVHCRFNSEGKANSFSFGLVRDDSYVPYNLLSSGEKCLFVISLFAAILDYTKSPLKLILVDDLLDHLDDKNFDSVFSSIESIEDIQFIFAGVNHVNSKSCNVIEVTK